MLLRTRLQNSRMSCYSLVHGKCLSMFNMFICIKQMNSITWSLKTDDLLSQTWQLHNIQNDWQLIRYSARKLKHWVFLCLYLYQCTADCIQNIKVKCLSDDLSIKLDTRWGCSGSSRCRNVVLYQSLKVVRYSLFNGCLEYVDIIKFSPNSSLAGLF